MNADAYGWIPTSLETHTFLDINTSIWWVMLIASGVGEYPPTFTKAFVLPLKKCVSSVYSQLTACLMAESVANLPASWELLMVAKIWKSPGVWSKLHREVFHNLLATVLYLLTVWGPVISISLDTLRSTWLGRKLTTNTAMKQTVTSSLQTHDTNFFYTRIQALVPWQDQYQNVDGESWRSGV